MNRIRIKTVRLDGKVIVTLNKQEGKEMECAWTKKECYNIIKKYFENRGQKCSLQRAKGIYENIANFNYKYSRNYETFYSKMCSDIAEMVNYNKECENR